jgi:hypothetical protein
VRIFLSTLLNQNWISSIATTSIYCPWCRA